MKDIIAGWIIERYENSENFKKQVREGNMSVNVLKKEEYEGAENYNFRITFNKIVEDMNREGSIKLKWYDRNNLIERIYFKLENIELFYNMAGVTPKDNILSSLKCELEELYHKVRIDWIKLFIQDLLNEVNCKKRVPSILEQKKEKLFTSLLGIDDIVVNNETMLERVFSKKYLRNSKMFEKDIRANLITAIKKYNTSIDTEMEDVDILSEIGIIKTDNDLHFKGNIQIKLNDKVIDLDSFPRGLGIDSFTLDDIEIVGSNIDRVISVENKANFICEMQQAQSKDFIVFSAGFYNPKQRKFLCRLRELLDSKGNVEYYHSGDLDLGGFNIFNHIKKEIFPSLLPYKMDKEIFYEYIEFAEFINDDKYIAKLKTLLSDEAFACFYEVIEFMINENRFLEQESLLF